jgi:hypothetical protein
MNQKNFAVVAMALTFSILAAISFNSIAAYAQEGAGNMTGMAGVKNTTIHLVPEHETAEQIRDEIRSNHPLLAAITDEIETMDERETLKYTIGVEIVSDLLKMHALGLIVNQTAQ